jgi:hypothetical protein
MIDILNRITNSDEKIIAISTHRLMLNTQHMNDIVTQLEPVFNDIKLIFVGSKEYKIKSIMKDIIRKSNITEKELIKNVTSKKVLNELIEKYSDKKIVIITTYHSLDKLKDVNINTLYCDEAHMLATALDSDSDKTFRKNFEMLKYNNCYFFTATPKDCVDEKTDDFLMNNEDVFGERIGITIKEAILGSYIPKPIIHLAIPTNYTKTDMDNIDNIVTFIVDSYKVHSEMVIKESFKPEFIAPKLLIRCKNVDQMWSLNERLIGLIPNVKIFAGASRKENGGEEYEIDGVIVTKDKHLEELQSMSNTDKLIALHVDTLSEGINVPGFTGVMFLSDTPTTIMKLLQNIGRGTRLHEKDRNMINDGYINSSDYSKWIKPYTFIILPIYNVDSEETQKHIATTLFNLRDKGVESVYRISIGSDISKSDELNVPMNRNNNERNPMKKIVGDIEHRIEDLTNIAKENEENEILASLVGLDKKLNYLKTLY